MIRVVIAGVVAGLVGFIGSAFCHTVLDFEGRAFKRVAAESVLAQFVGFQAPEPGVYGFPMLPEGFESLPPEEQEKEWARINEVYKAGPSGLLVVAPTGEDMMSFRELGLELLTTIGGALIVAWVVSRFAPGTGFFTRWAAVVLFGVFTWLATSASFGIWYRFPWAFLTDGVYAAVIEWAMAGLMIASIVRPSPVPNTSSQDQVKANARPPLEGANA